MSYEIVIRNLQSGGNANALRTAYFADSFQRADQPFFTGDRYTCSFMPGDTQTLPTNAEAGINVAANNLVLANPTGGGSIPKCFVQPLPFNYLAFPWNGALAIPQFAEIKVTAASNVLNSGFGIAVLMDSNSGNCYSMRNANSGVVNEYFIERFVAGVNTTLVGPVTPLNIGDVMRFEATPSVGAVLLTYKINGVTIGTFNDNTGSRLLVGVPGLVTNGTNPGASFSYQNFKMGTLPQTNKANDFP